MNKYVFPYSVYSTKNERLNKLNKLILIKKFFLTAVSIRVNKESRLAILIGTFLINSSTCKS